MEGVEGKVRCCWGLAQKNPKFGFGGILEDFG